jgi:hypothetical protein
LVLLLLAVMWAAVLGPALWRKRSGGMSQDSIGAFRRQLGVLQRTGPNLVNPANSLRAGAPPGSRPDMIWPGRPASARVTTSYTSPAAVNRRRTQQRRRDVLLVLSGTLVGALVLGAVPRLHILWMAAAAVAVLLFAYIALLVRARNIAAEKELKLAYLPQPAPASETALLLRRSAN